MGRPRKKQNLRWYVATDSGVTDIDGVPFHYRRNVTRVREDDPVLRQAPHSFKPVDGEPEPAEIERATASGNSPV